MIIFSGFPETIRVDKDKYEELLADLKAKNKQLNKLRKKNKKLKLLGGGLTKDDKYEMGLEDEYGGA